MTKKTIFHTLSRRAALTALAVSAAAIAGFAAPSAALPRTSRSRSASSAARTRTSGASSPQEAAKQGLTIETVVFNDYTQPNEALERGEIDANAFQHQPYLDNQIKTQGYHIVPVGYTGVWPIGLYSKKYARRRRPAGRRGHRRAERSRPTKAVRCASCRTKASSS